LSAFCLAAIIGGAVTSPAQDFALEPFLQSATIDGPTGLLTIPTATVLDNKCYALAVHKYLVKVNFGLFSRLELGIRADVEQFRTDGSNDNRYLFHGKYRFVSEPDQPVSASLGFWDKDLYLSLDKHLVNFYDLYATTGVKLQENGRWRLMFGVAKVINNSEFIFDKAGGTYNIGYRMMFAQKIKLDLGLIDLQNYKHFGFDNLVFGINFSEPLW